MITFLIFVTAALVGQVAHWIVGAKSREILVSYFTYMRLNLFITLQGLIVINISVFGILATGAVEVTLQNVAMAVMAGYTYDSILGKFPK